MYSFEGPRNPESTVSGHVCSTMKGRALDSLGGLDRPVESSVSVILRCVILF